ncbi:MAG: class I SAM-dependent methyltransferase [Chthoniobacterales bacterium]
MKIPCCVCGGSEFVDKQVLWPELVREWKLESYEIEYINKQQGTSCLACGCNMRSQALALAIQTSFQGEGLFSEFIISKSIEDIKILEINKAGDIHNFLSIHRNHRLVEYPSYDMMDLDLPYDEFDLVVHSDTLEHVPDPRKALKECYRILKKNGKCIFTIPIIVDRLSRSRNGLPASYHGSPDCSQEDYRVFTEFGCDSWKLVLEAGFKSIKIHALEYPHALALETIK